MMAYLPACAFLILITGYLLRHGLEDPEYPARGKNMSTTWNYLPCFGGRADSTIAVKLISVQRSSMPAYMFLCRTGSQGQRQSRACTNAMKDKFSILLNKSGRTIRYNEPALDDDLAFVV
jgi:hypothetical protein